ncbi:hypothetical protein CKO_00918 [Citrobacter koseri ATCC BAA-895]|uniref:Uncharacterized protein n=1 Tax=Citrobacter koseri (strain ATCC BAA-895 / CDC 4225-83 / SGSC4696) TaxID=290338 RepID=A8AF05_CITK8|nr:hypothetical protein CKO_00918 [Citrobacter koseri ATCC BAA-895]
MRNFKNTQRLSCMGMRYGKTGQAKDGIKVF